MAQQVYALALRGMGRGAAPAIPELITALKDPAATVRMSAALTLGAVGPAANSAVPALTSLVDIPDLSKLTNDGVQVIRNATYALGDIGPDARPAIPALMRITHVRIQYIAQEAVAKIEGKPVAK